MSTNLIEECTRRVCEREAAEYGMEVTAGDLSRNRLYVAAVVADVLDLLSADGRIAITPIHTRPEAALEAAHDAGESGGA